MKTAILVIVLALLGAGATIVYIKASNSPPSVPSAGASASGGVAERNVALCAKHGIADSACAFCHPELVEKLGFCAEHDVPEALCTRCSPSLIPAFKAEGDWCAEHALPESQCKICKGEAPSE